MPTPLQHPGEIRIIDAFTGKQELRRADSFPENRRFVFIKNGKVVETADELTEIVPIVEVLITPLDANGILTSKEVAKTIRIVEYGPARRLLRSATMVKE